MIPRTSRVLSEDGTRAVSVGTAREKAPLLGRRRRMEEACIVRTGACGEGPRHVT